MKLLITFVLLISFGSIQAQWKYQGMVEGGLINGNWETNAYVQTTHGVQYKQWSAGLGTGIDYYRYRSVPVFIEVQSSFGKKTVRPFIIAAAGINATWPTEEQKQQWNGWMQTTQAEFSNGFYSRIGGGILLNANAKVKLSLKIAYSYKTLSRKYTEWNWEPWPQPVNTIQKTMEYRLNRLNVGLGVSF